MTDTSKLIERLRRDHDRLNCNVTQNAPSPRFKNDAERDHEIETAMKDCWEAADALADLEARLRIAEKRADDAEARNDFLIAQLDILREKARQS